MVIKFLKSILTYLCWFISSLIFSSICFLVTLFPNRYENRLYFKLTKIWNWILVKSTFIKVQYEGLENLPKEPAILIGNHASAMDIPIMEMLAGSYPHIWATKMSYAKIPIFGLLLKRMHVPIQRDDVSKAGRAFMRLYALAKQHGSHIVLFPEGTRSKDGKLGSFLNGFSSLAKKMNRPVIPVYISGLYNIFPKGSLIINSDLPCKVRVGEPLYIEEDSIEQFNLRIRQWFEKQAV